MYTDQHNLTTTNPLGITEENAFLYTIELFVVMRKRGLNTNSLEFTIESALREMHLGNGRYKQNPSYPSPESHTSNNAYMSHDQLTAIMVYYSITNQVLRMNEIVSYLQYGISYDNVNETVKRVLHPRDLIFYYTLIGNPVGYLFVPLLWMITLYTFLTDKKVRDHGTFKKTDGELLYYIKRESTNIFKPIDFVCNLLIKKRFGNWDKVFSTYFKDTEHPLNKLINK